MKDFFISYNKADRAWAEWIAWILEAAGFSVVIDAWDFRAGENFILKMHSAARETNQTIALISENYLTAEYTHPEWAAAFARDPQGQTRILIPIKISPCDPKGLLGQIIHVDLIGLSEAQAKARLLGSLQERAKPDVAPVFPRIEGTSPQRASYPGSFEGPGDGATEETIPSNVPVRTQLFVGRDEFLNQLHETLGVHARSSRRIQALTGLGGIGKTQTAIEYAGRFSKDYNALLWAVAESSESLRADFGAIATLLGLPEANLQDQTSIVNAVKKWLVANDGWLLILDNADDPTLIAEFIPQPFKGSILLTSRAQVFDSLGIFNPLELQSMSSDEANEFLMQRSGFRDLDERESHAAKELAFELDYLPLALEQAGAYIRELQGSFSDYLESYHRRGLALLEKGYAPGKYRESIGTTWALNFQQIAESSNASADFLRISAFMSPDRIPIEFFADAADHLGPNIESALAGVQSDPLVVDELIKPPVRFSLIHRDRTTRTLNIHRLVQAVVMDAMDKDTRVLWATRVVKALEQRLLDVDNSTISDWVQIERLVPHVQRVADVIASGSSVSTVEAVRLFNRAGRYLHLRGRLPESQKLYNEALRIAQQVPGTDDLDLASSLHNKGWLHNDVGEYDKAEPLLLRALEIRENASNTDPVHIAQSLIMLGGVFKIEEHYERSRQCYSKAMAILEAHDLDNSLDLVRCLHGLGGVHYTFGEFDKAERLEQRAITILESDTSKIHYFMPTALSNVAMTKIAKGEYEEGERMLTRSIAMYESVFGCDYPRLAIPLIPLAYRYMATGKSDAARALLERALNLRQATFGPNHPEIADSLHHCGELSLREGRYTEAEDLLGRALLIAEDTLGPNSSMVSEISLTLERLHLAKKKYSKAEIFGRRALTITKSRFGLQNPRTCNAMLIYAQVLRRMNRKGEAQKLEAQANKIQSRLRKKEKNNR